MKTGWLEQKRDVHSDTLSVDSSEVSILKERDEVRLSSFLEGHNSRRLEAEIGLVVYHPTNQPYPMTKLRQAD